MQKIFLCVACLAVPTVYAAESYLMNSVMDSIVVEEKDNSFFTHDGNADNNETSEPRMLANGQDISLAKEQGMQMPSDKTIIEEKRQLSKNTATTSAKLKTLSKHSQWQHLLFYKNG